MNKNDIRANKLAVNNDFLDSFNPRAIALGIASRLRIHRLSLNLSQQALATRSGVSLGSLKRFESKAEISLRNLLMIAVALRTTEEFASLFATPHYQSINDVLSEEESKTRKRGRKNE